MSPAQRREQVLDAALTVVAKRSLADLSMEAVAAEAGVAKTVVYSVFRSRTELVSSLLAREHAAGIHQVRAAIPDQVSDMNAGDRFGATISSFVTEVLRHPVRWRLILTAPDTAPTEYRNELRSARGGLITATRQLLDASPTVLPDMDTELLAHLMISTGEMLGRLAIGDRQRFTTDRLTEFAQQIAARLVG